MTAAPEAQHVRRLTAAAVPQISAMLESDFGPVPSARAALANQFLLDALDRGDYSRFVVWPPETPAGVLYAGHTGTIVPAGAPAAGPPLAAASERVSWRVLVGDARIAEPLLEAVATGMFRRRPSAREQRFMIASDAAWTIDQPAGFRPARIADLERLTEFASRLHVEDRMGPPIPRTGRGAIRSRMAESVARGGTWVVERGRTVVAKVDLSLHSARRGAQIAGVFVDAAWRGHGLATAVVAAVTRTLLEEGSPGVTLHVRADNDAAITAYSRAGFTDHGPWTLAVR